METQFATIDQLDALADLFDQYRVFYGQSSDRSAARAFLQARLQKQDALIFVAIENGEMAGFTQLYPSFSSVAMRPIWILNDLFVSPSFRRKGVAQQLMNTAAAYARETGVIRLELATQITNQSAQALYESLGYVKDREYYHYSLPL